MRRKWTAALAATLLAWPTASVWAQSPGVTISRPLPDVSTVTIIRDEGPSEPFPAPVVEGAVEIVPEPLFKSPRHWASAQELGELSQKLAAAVMSADEKSAEVANVASELEDRATGLRSVDKRLGQFEDRMAKWTLVEQELSRALEQVAARQGTVEAVRADLDRMLVMAETTSATVREITSAHEEIEKRRGVLKDVMGQLKNVKDTASTLEERHRQIARAEERLARAEALQVEVRSSLEALQGQKALVDQAVEKAGSLQFLLRQADAMIDGLRDERSMSARVREAVSIAREEGDDEGQAMAA